MNIGERIQRYRKEAGLSQEQLAARLSVSRQAVSKWETGESLPDLAKVVQMSELFGVSTDALLKGETPAEPAEAAPSAAPPAKAGRRRVGLLATGAALTGLGGAGVLVLWLLSTILRSTTLVEVKYANGMVEYVPQVAYELGAFLNTYHLEALFTLCWVLLAAGAILLLWRKWKLRKDDKPSISSEWGE